MKNKKSKVTIALFLSIFIGQGVLFYYLNNSYNALEYVEVKKKFLSLSGLPDLAFYTEHIYDRHRSLANNGDIYNVSPLLFISSKSSYVYKNSMVK
jgi:hypothetical protein